MPLGQSGSLHDFLKQLVATGKTSDSLLSWGTDESTFSNCITFPLVAQKRVHCTRSSCPSFRRAVFFLLSALHCLLPVHLNCPHVPRNRLELACPIFLIKPAIIPIDRIELDIHLSYAGHCSLEIRCLGEIYST